MNILIACEDLRVGGAQVFCLNLGKALGKNHNVYLYSQYRDYVDSELVRCHYPNARIIAPNIPWDKGVRKLDRLLYKLNIDWSLREHFVVRHMRNTINHLNVQLVHSNMFKSDYFFCKAMKNCPVPLVITMHGNYETFLDNIREAKGERILNYMQKVGDTVKRIDALVYLTDKNLRVLSELDSNTMQLSTSFVRRKIYNGFSHNSTKSVFDGRQKLGISGHHTLFGLVARGIPEKGWESAIRALLAMDDNKNAALILVGDSSYLDTLKGGFSQQENIHFVGYSSNPLEWIDCFDVGLLPTVYGESLPTSIIEYLSCGKPVISTDIGEIRQMLTLGAEKAGEILTVKDKQVNTKELTKAMENLHRNKKKRARFAKTAKVLSARFSMGKCRDSYLELYYFLIDGHESLSASTGTNIL